MKKNIIIHIGDAKTGSSTIQQYLTSNREVLKKSGVLYPKTGLLAPHGIAHHKLSFCLNKNHKINKDECCKLYEKLFQEIDTSDCNTAIISSEGFSSLRSNDEIESLKNLFRKYNIKIITYLRRPDKWIESWYAQVVKNKPFITKSFYDFLSIAQKPSILTVLIYAKIFKKENTIVRNFEKTKFYKNNLIEDFFYSLNLKKIGQNIKVINISPNRDVIELLRRLNLTLKLNDFDRLKLYDLIIKYFNDPKKSKKFFISNKDRIKYLSQFENEIQKLNEMFSNGKNFFLLDDLAKDNSKEEIHIPNINIFDTEFSLFLKNLLSIKEF